MNKTVQVDQKMEISENKRYWLLQEQEAKLFMRCLVGEGGQEELGNKYQ